MGRKKYYICIRKSNAYFDLKRTKKVDAAWRNCYWIDIVKLCESLLGDGQSLEKVVYFTASPFSPQMKRRRLNLLVNNLTNNSFGFV